MKANGTKTLHSQAKRPVRFYSSLSGPLLLDSKFPFSWWPKKGILANPGFVRGGHRVYPKTRYRTWSEKARFELKSEIENL